MRFKPVSACFCGDGRPVRLGEDLRAKHALADGGNSDPNADG